MTEKFQFFYRETTQKQRISSFIATKQWALGLTIADMYWLIESIIGIFLIYKGIGRVLEDDSSKLERMLPVIGIMMIVFAILRVTNTFEEEVNILSSLALVALIMTMVSMADNKVIDKQILTDSVRMSYNAVIPDVDSISNNEPTNASGNKKSCQWFNTRTNEWLNGDKAKWCKDAVEKKWQGNEFCTCK